MERLAYVGAAIHDGARLHENRVLLVSDGVVEGIAEAVPEGYARRDLKGDTLCPGFVDLQVNGGGGVMFDGGADVGTLRTIAAAHRRTGTVGLLPTLITDRPEASAAAVETVARAVAEGVPGILGLHLEGPHLSQARKGAHDPGLIRPIGAADMEILLGAAARLPNLMLTVAAETVTPEQITRLDAAGVIVSLGHSDAGYDACRAAFAAGARCTTHLYNAMSGLGHREPGLVGATLDGAGAAGLIADAIHVHPAAIRIAMRARPEGLFLVTDAMAPVGSEIAEFTLNGRRILRRDGRLTLADGTLAGADLTMPRAIAVMTGEVGTDPGTAIAMATGRPAALLRDRRGAGRLVGAPLSRVVRLAADYSAAAPLSEAGAAISR
ncbi:N-acetylglucosamine-6-phosphate deacetylase [Limimaricola pyoseonensis]|uniref:N-acetylglucosamine 6-phosphate deacetylase n=1 Tax=Limimaricola pyoseonensis TaxID=521013 RepID=A0A1G7L5L6_9RHOB|nr:N-acetylglucosamine-6-phosphate deacetylase [Limimaricola pyoseonensis]SDF44340.1 N-acetylglucosamine 6-phosphate deacetylase [Limimaricola pyoseonensis]